MVFYVALSSVVDLFLSLRPLFSSVPCVSRYTGQIRSANTGVVSKVLSKCKFVCFDLSFKLNWVDLVLKY